VCLGLRRVCGAVAKKGTMNMQMRRRVRLGIPSAVLVVWACAGTVDPPAPLQMTSEHFLFSATASLSDSVEMREGIARAEALYAAIATVVRPAITPASRVSVRLEGDFTDRGPYVSTDGTIHLYRYSEAEGGYWALLAHEMVHAVDIERAVSIDAGAWPWFGFINEGWAEYLAQLVDPDKKGFPFYGFPEDVVAGFWVTSGIFVAMDVLRWRHVELNQPCEHQAYPERASWFRHVDEAFGRDAALALAYPPTEPTAAYVESILGYPVEAVDRQWRTWLTTRYAAAPGAPLQAQAYRVRTSFYQPCTL
jgi:hypothetical protein